MPADTNYLGVFLLSLLVSCNVQKDSKTSVLSQKEEIDEFHIRLDTILLEENHLKLSVISDYIFNENQERPIFLDQLVTLTRNHEILYSRKHDGGYDSLKTDSGYLKYLKNFIVKIASIDVNGTNYLIIDGWGGCNYCFDLLTYRGRKWKAGLQIISE